MVFKIQQAASACILHGPDHNAIQPSKDSRPSRQGCSIDDHVCVCSRRPFAPKADSPRRGLHDGRLVEAVLHILGGGFAAVPLLNFLRLSSLQVVSPAVGLGNTCLLHDRVPRCLRLLRLRLFEDVQGSIHRKVRLHLTLLRPQPRDGVRGERDGRQPSLALPLDHLVQLRGKVGVVPLVERIAVAFGQRHDALLDQKAGSQAAPRGRRCWA
mmetsp:Transcript_71083/g.191394  ORF Transcript_71083/g.191394 Transcript_71083/m.191394 type:complete len:212 (-) Transcript_71083:7-642(-)